MPRHRSSLERRLSRLAPALCFATLLPAYGSGLSNHLTEDSLWYAQDILHPTELFFHPHHLLYDPVMRVLALPALWMSGGPDEQLLYLQWVNVILGAAAVSVFCAAAIGAGAGALNAGAVSLLLGLSAFSYSYSSQIEVYSLTCLFLAVALIGHARPHDTTGSRLLTAAGFAGALFFHQTAIFFGLALVTDGWLARRESRSRLARKLAMTLALPLLFVGLVYLCAGLALGHRSPLDFWHWVTLHMQWGYWGAGTLSESTIATAWGRFWQAVLAPGDGQKRLAMILVSALVIYVVARIAALGRAAFRRPSLIAGCLVWMAALAVFTTWWDARGAEFWGMFLMPVCLVLSLLGPGPEERSRGVASAAMIVMLLVLAVRDLTLYRRNNSPNDLREAARALSHVARNGDLVVAAGTDGTTYYRIYLTGRRVEVLAVNVKPAAQAAARCPHSSLTSCLVEVLEDDARAVISLGGRLLVDHRVLTGRITTTRLTERLDTAEFKAELERLFEAQPLAGVYELRPRRAATDATHAPSNSPSR